jgi:multimeric flavodoxin WrbA
MSDDGIKLLGVSGSPRRNGGTQYAVHEALRYAEEKHGALSEYFGVAGKTIGFCTQCDACTRKKDGCAVHDDVEQLYPLLSWADAVIFGTPIYQGGVSAQLKALMDRCRAPVVADPDVLRNKAGAGIAVGGDRNGGQESALRQVHDFCLLNLMVPVGGGAYGANLGAAVWSRDLGAAGVEDDAAGMKAVRRTVDRLVEVARVLRAGRDALGPGR